MNCNGGPNEVDDRNVNFSTDYTPIITYAGDKDLFNSLSTNLTKSIATESLEWRRSYDRPIKQVKLKASFVPYNNILSPEKDNHLINRPVFHTYWSECSDVDVYKSSVKEEIDCWLKSLAKVGIQDWMIIIVENYDLKKSNKLLPRTTVLDKIRNDFASKHGDRCLSIINPIKSESRSAESWRGLINRIRHLMLTAYDRTLLKFEETIREQREKRNHPSWNFCHYFLLQEELAFVLEMLGLYDESLIQYDELDALFTQFVLNSNVSDPPKWLNSFQSPLNSWTGVNLKNSIDYQLRALLADCKATLLDFRSYLFGRQCAMLLQLKRPWEVAQRCLSFVNDTFNELRILEIQKPDGSVECWAFLCALEVLHACESLNLSVECKHLLDMHTATLWALARNKLENLGKLCGLMPGNDPTSEQLHKVVYLIAGMGDSEISSQDTKKLTPTDKLKEALSSKEAFKKQYLEHTELAMGTYKHVNRIRSARLIGKELAKFYSEMNEDHKAVVFLLDALKTYTDEGWPHLAAQTMHELAQCYKKMDDVERYIKMSSSISAMDVLHITIRNSYLDETLSYLKLLSSPEPLITELGNCFNIIEMSANVSDKVIQDCVVIIEIMLKSLFPRPINCTYAALSVEEVQKSVKKKGVKSNEENSDLLLKCQINDMKPSLDTYVVPLPIISKLFFKEDKSIDSAKVNIGKNYKSQVKRSDSVKLRKPSETNLKGNFNDALICNQFLINPGINKFSVSKKVDKSGIYKVGQLSLVVENKLEFLSSLLEPRICYQVAKTSPTINLQTKRDLLAGLKQTINLIIFSGSIKIKEGSVLKLRTSRGLSILMNNEQEKKIVREAEIPISSCEPFETINIELNMIAELPPKKDSSSMEHKLNIQCPWEMEENITLHFGTPLMSNMKLHTAKHRKFIQIIVSGLSNQLLQLTEPSLNSNTSADIHFKSLNPTGGQKLIIGNAMSVSFMWEIEVGKDEDKSIVPIKTDFQVKYFPIDLIQESEEVERTGQDETDDPLYSRNMELVEKGSNVYWCNFDISDYATLFTVSSKIEASGSSGEFCRSGSMCHLCLTVTRMQQNPINPNPPPQLMYEVLADQTMWAVCGRTAGIISLEVVDKQSVTLDVMPLTSGFLPLPVVRLSRYIPAAMDSKNDSTRKNDLGPAVGPRLEPFSAGQVYNASKAQQVHVLPAVSSTNENN